MELSFFLLLLQSNFKNLNNMKNKIVEKLQSETAKELFEQQELFEIEEALESVEKQEMLKTERAVEISNRVDEFLEYLDFYAGCFGEYNQNGYDISYTNFETAVRNILLKEQK